MAEPSLDFEEPTEPEEMDSDTLPDGVEPVKGLKIFENLDEGNLIEQLGDKADEVAQDALRLLDEAKQSMQEWKDCYDKALKLAKLEPESAKKTFPFEDASNVMMPFIMEAALDFHSRVVPELVWAKNVVAMKTYGTDTDEKADRATRVADFMNWQISQAIPMWRKEQDKMLLGLPTVGTAYKKTYYNQDEQECRSDLLQGDEVIFNHDYRTFEEAPEKFVEEEYTRNDVLEYIRGAQEWELDEETLPQERDMDKPFEFVRAYMWVDLDDDGLTEPYEVVVYCETQKVVSIYPAYDEEGIIANEDGQVVKVEMVPIFTQYQFLPDPEGGPMGLGWGILLGDLFEALNTTVRQLIDAGTLANLAGNSGLIDHQLSGATARGNRQQSGPVEVRMGELTPISTGGKPLAQSVVQFPYSGPNTTLFQLTDWMLTQIRGMTNSAYNMDTNSQEAAMMYLARLQQGLKVPNSIVMRVYNAACEEFRKLSALNFKHYSNPKYNKVLDPQDPADMRADFNPDDCDVTPATDPSQGSDVERQQRSQMVLEEAKAQPAPILNVREAYLDWLEAMKVPDPERLAPEPPPGPDPTEQMVIANLQRQAELDERRMQIDEAELQMKAAESSLKAMHEGRKLGLEMDAKEADIVKTYADAFKALWEIGMAGPDPVRTVENMESRLIDNRTAPPPPVPLESPDPNPQTQGEQQ